MYRNISRRTWFSERKNVELHLSSTDEELLFLRNICHTEQTAFKQTESLIIYDTERHDTRTVAA